MQKNHGSHRALVKERGTLWLVWLIPLVALMMAGWLIYEHYTKKGTDIVVVFESGKGIEVGKTPLIYQGIKIGVVSDMSVDPDDIYKVRATITVDSRAAQYVTRKGTKFIKVEPKVSLTEITGLDTILNGVYIDLYPAGATKKEILSKPLQFTFNGLDRYPPKRYEKGLYITLKTKKASVRLNAPVQYKGFVVGKIIDRRLDGNNTILYTAYIENKYRTLINGETKFWKVEGLDVHANLAGIKVRVGSLATLVAGGVAFDSPDINSKTEPKPFYTLYNSKLETDMAADMITVTARNAYNIDPDFTSVVYRGFDVGKIVSVHYDPRRSRSIFKIRLRRKFRHLANEKAWFWIVQPQISLRGVKGLDAIAKGAYIAFDTEKADAPKKTNFQLHEEPMPAKGIKIRFSALHAESIRSGTTIFYKDVPIGRITKISLKQGERKLDIEGTIYRKYADLVNDSSLFYVKSGIEAELSWREIHLASGSLETMVAGGVEMVTLDPKAPRTDKRFFIYKNYANFRKARYIKKGGAYFYVVMDDLGSLSKGAPLLYKRLRAGEVVSTRYLPKEDKIEVLVFVAKDFVHRINASTRFMNVSGIEMNMNFPDIKIKTETLETIATGGLKFVTPEADAPKVEKGHRFVLYDKKRQLAQNCGKLELWMDETHGLKEGSPILYKDFTVGHVGALHLMNNMVKAILYVQKPYLHLFGGDAKIWLKAFKADIEGVKNVDRAVAGPALAVTPGKKHDTRRSFMLSAVPPPPTYGKEGLRISVVGDRRGSLKVGSPLLYRQVAIGRVESWHLAQDGTGVVMNLFVEPKYVHFIRRNAKFYMAGAIGMEVGLTGVKIRTETLKTLIAGGIGMAVPDKPGEIVEDGHRFKMYPEPEKKWLKWKPKL